LILITGKLNKYYMNMNLSSENFNKYSYLNGSPNMRNTKSVSIQP
jgi:hypothetical protein